MANVIKHKRGSGSDPVASDLVVGEVAIRTDVGKLFTKMDNGSVAEIAGGGSDIAINTLSSSSATGGGSATFNGSAYRFTLSAPPNVSAAQLLVSINGVIQKPVAGTGQPSEGFSVDGTDIILGDAPATGSDFFILTFKSLGVSEPADNSVTSAKIVDGAIVNADINASAAIAGSKINPVSLADVGIGVSSPNVRLHQHIGTSGTNSHRFTNTTTGTGSTDGFILGLSGDEHVLLWNYENTPFRLATNSTERVRVTESGLVGIGTSSPSKTLHIHGDSGSELPVYWIRGGSSVGGYLYSDGGGSGIVGGDGVLANTGMYLVTDTRIDFRVNGSERMRIDSSGRLLLGTTTGDPYGNRQLTVNSSSGTTAIEVRSATDGDGRIIFTDSTSNDSGAYKGQIRYDQTDDFMSFNTNGNNERLRINSSGNVGIGTGTPDTLLHLSGADTAVIRLENTDTTLGNDQIIGGIEFEKQDSTGAGVGIAGAVRLKSMSSVGQAASMFFSTSNSGGNDQTRMTLNFDGNLGIGTTSPSYKLHLTRTDAAGDYAYFGASSDGGQRGLEFTSSDTGIYLGAVHTINASSGGGILAFATASSERMRITSDGYSKHSTNGNYDSYVKAVTAHEFRQYANSSTLWSSNTNTSQTWEILRADSARSATNAMNMITTTTGNLSDDQHRLIGNGDILCDGTAGAGAADYAEYFEWTDSNSLNEDRRGMTVVLVDGKVRKTTSSDSPDNVIGVVSANPVVVGDAQWRHWQSKYLRDDYGNYIYEDHNQITWTDDNGVKHDYEDWNVPSGVTVPGIGVTTVTHDENGVKLQHQKLNPSYDESKTYIPRSERKEWEAIGMVGKLRVRKGQITGTRWIKMRDISDNVEEWLVR